MKKLEIKNRIPFIIIEWILLMKFIISFSSSTIIVLIIIIYWLKFSDILN